MKIFIVSHNYPSERQPYLNTFIRDHYQAVSAMENYEPQLLVPTPYSIPFTERWKRNRSPLRDEDSGKRISYLSIPSMAAPGFTAGRLSRKLLNSIPSPNNVLFHLHWIYPAGLTIPDLADAGYKTVLNIHGSDWYKTIGKPRFSSLIEDALNAAGTLCVSGPKLKEDILDRFPDLDLRVTFNYIDTGQFYLPDEKQIREAKNNLGFDKGKFHFLTIANIRHEKGVDLLLDAVKMLDRDDLCFHVVGQPPSGEYAGLIQSKLDKLIPGRVLIHKPVPRDELVTWYHAADAFLLPSRSEGFNVSLLEALSTGLPAIATNTGGAKQVLGSESGWLVEPGNAEPLHDSILSFMHNREPGRQKKSHHFIRENYSIEQYRSLLHEIYSGQFNSLL